MTEVDFTSSFGEKHENMEMELQMKWKTVVSQKTQNVSELVAISGTIF